MEPCSLSSFFIVIASWATFKTFGWDNTWIDIFFYLISVLIGILGLITFRVFYNLKKGIKCQEETRYKKAIGYYDNAIKLLNYMIFLGKIIEALIKTRTGIIALPSKEILPKSHPGTIASFSKEILIKSPDTPFLKEPKLSIAGGENTILFKGQKLDTAKNGTIVSITYNN